MVQYICLVGCKIQPIDGYVAVCLFLTIVVSKQGSPPRHTVHDPKVTGSNASGTIERRLTCLVKESKFFSEMTSLSEFGFS